MDEEQYFNAFHKYLARSTDHPNAIEWVRTHGHQLDLHQVRTVLSIGGGSGALDLPILSNFPSLEKYVVVDPSTIMIEAFKQALQCMQQEHKLSGGMLKDRNIEDMFTFECCKFEEANISRLADMLSKDQAASSQKIFETTQQQACLPLFDFAIMSHCLYHMDPEAAVLKAGLVARKLLIFHDDEDVTNKNLNKLGFGGNENLASYPNVLQMLEDLAARPRQQFSQADIHVPQRTVANFINNQSSPRDWVHVNNFDVWQLPVTFDFNNVDRDTLDFLLDTLTKSEEEHEKRCQVLQRQIPDGYFTGSTNVFLVTFDIQ